ncbi:hypothetical protein N658DRAFT_526607 [Parathielavia hyrcaniae]|uniref:Uncharacterized protein n=1 Tax=Parathielavia hyrcaniae TaxID=113614 RepID=A0AAN6PU43_9PEZI|nr:hypothetical protein N658DRAFT_526607 [Parathielavia hyrcaniae]
MASGSASGSPVPRSGTRSSGPLEVDSRDALDDSLKTPCADDDKNTTCPPEIIDTGTVDQPSLLGPEKPAQGARPGVENGPTPSFARIRGVPPPEGSEARLTAALAALALIQPPPLPEDGPMIVKRPESHSIPPEQLDDKLRNLLMVEKQCVELDSIRISPGDFVNELTSDEWQVWIAFHQNLLQKYYDLFLASQHSSASPALRGLAAKYAPARMWRHGIHRFLDTLKHYLPQSLDHMLAFIGIAYPILVRLHQR